MLCLMIFWFVCRGFNKPSNIPVHLTQLFLRYVAYLVNGDTPHPFEYFSRVFVVFDYCMRITNLMIFLYDVENNVITCSFCNFPIKLQDARSMFFAQVTLHNMFIFVWLVFVLWCNDYHIFYS